VAKLKAIDFFAGAGGFSTGAAKAGLDVVLAANHWAVAVATHKANHPKTHHVCQDLNLIDFTTLPDHDVLLASPCCQGHSRARGSNDVKGEVSRQTAWCIPHALEYIDLPKAIIVENVPEFLKWERYAVWKAAMKSYGYQLTENVLNAADFGVPQNRVRVFIVATLGRRVAIEAPMKKHRAADTIIDWDSPYFKRIDSKERADVVMRQVANGRKTFGDRFLVVYNGSEKNGRSIEKPLPTVTTNDRLAVVNGDMIRLLKPEELKRAMGFPKTYQLPEHHKDCVKLLGNAVCPPVAEEVCSQVRLAIA
jgi:DNA (cytosine-5)-methyltransferase 1